MIEKPAPCEQEVEVKTAVGSVRARGYDAFQFLILVGIAYLVSWSIASGKDNKIEHDRMTAAMVAMVEQQEIATYVSTLTPDERIKLRLDMPESLRKKMRARD